MSSKKIGLLVLTLFIVGSIDSLRNMPTAALFGPSLIFFFVVSALTFLLPIALISAELSSYHGEKNGVYQWVKEAFGDKTAFLTIWLQWINTTIWFPTILSFIAGGLAYLIDPALAHSKIFVVCVILFSFWGMTFLSLKNFSLSAHFVSLCTIFGFLLPLFVMLGLLGIWLYHGNPIQIQLNARNWIPSFSHLNHWIALTAVFTAFLGMELAAVNVRDVKNPQRNYPIGVILASLIILCTMIAGSLAIAFVIPTQKINLIAGIFETLQYYLHYFHLNYLALFISALIVLASLGEMINWIISPARGMQQAAMNSNLPALFRGENQHGMPANILILQAVIVSFVCLAYTLFKSVNDIYWLLTDLSTELYLIMYCLMFTAAIYLHYKDKHIIKIFKIPGGAFSKWILCLLGLISCVVTIVIGFIPPPQLDFGGLWNYTLIFGGSMIALCLPAFFLMRA